MGIFRFLAPTVLTLVFVLFSACSGGTNEVPMECPTGQALVDGHCYQQCIISSECPDGFTCSLGVCVYIPDTTDGDNTDNETGGCIEDNDCPSPTTMICNDDGECQEISEPDGDDDTADENACLRDSDCPSGHMCKDDGSCEIIPVTDGDADTDPDSIDQPDEEELDINPDDPRITSHPAELNFGSVAQGVSVPLQLEIYNAGGAELILDAVALESPDPLNEFEIQLPESLPITVAPSKRITIDIIFTAQDELEDTNALLIGSNDPATPTLRTPLYSRVKLRPKIEVTPASIPFGLRSVGDTYQQVLTIKNAGKMELKLTSFAWRQPASGIWGLENVPENLSNTNPHILANQNDELEILVTFTPNAEEDFSNTLTIVSNDDDNTFLDIPVSGSGGMAEIIVEPLFLNFVNATPENPETLYFTITNNGLAPLENFDFDFGTTTQEFGFEAPPFNLVVPGGEEAEIGITYRPDDTTIDEGQVTVNSNAAASPIVRFNATGNPPCISVQPEEVHFGRAFMQAPAISQTVWISNGCDGNLYLNEISLETNPSVISIDRTPEMGSAIRQGEIVGVQVTCAPEFETPASNNLLIESNDPNIPTVVVPMDCEGLFENIPPVADAGEGFQLAPLQSITLDGTNSYDQDGYIIDYHWWIEGHPMGSFAELIPNSSPTPRFTCDLAGTYSIKLKVTDNAFAESAVDTVRFECIPNEMLHIQLVWDADDVDLDLHLLKPNGGLYWDTDGGDCFYKTCIPTDDNPDPVDWGTYGHPSMDRDDTNGYGPENINLDDPGDGTYQVQVFYYDAHQAPSEATTATVRVFVYGIQKFEKSVAFDQEHLRWEVCDIQWRDDFVYITELDTPIEVDNSHGY